MNQNATLLAVLVLTIANTARRAALQLPSGIVAPFADVVNRKAALFAIFDAIQEPGNDEERRDRPI